MLLSSFEIADNTDNLSIKYQNIYAINGVLTFVTTEDNLCLPYVNKWPATHSWRPVIKLVKNQEEFEKFTTQYPIIETHELTLLGDFLWYGNIGHALFDGLYPQYLAMLKFGYIDQPFSLLVGPDWDNKKSLAYAVLNTFSGGEPLSTYTNITHSKLICYKTLISGSGQAGNRVMRPDYVMYGEKYNGLKLFKSRMLTSHKLTCDKPLNDTLNIIVVNNKRYSDKEKHSINSVITSYDKVSNVRIKFIDWYHDFKSFQEQLEMFVDVDIQVTGPGTGMMYTPFLKHGAVNVNLGYMEKTQTNTARPNLKIANCKVADFIFPGYMEQQVCQATKWVSTLYYDRYVNNDIEIAPLRILIDRAITLAKTKTIQENNLNIDALIFKEYCAKVNNSKQVSKHLTDIAFFIELFVNEHPAAVPTTLVDIPLLRKIKDNFGYDRTYEY